MLLHLLRIRSSKSGQIAYVFCAMMVTSYILFNVLDLDGSDLSRLFGPVEKTSIVAVVQLEAELFKSPEPFASHDGILLRVIEQPDKFTSQQHAKLLPFSQLDITRSHGYRASLPRNSLSDSSPYF